MNLFSEDYTKMSPHLEHSILFVVQCQFLLFLTLKLFFLLNDQG